MPSRHKINSCCGVDYFCGFEHQPESIAVMFERLFNTPIQKYEEFPKDLGWDVPFFSKKWDANSYATGEQRRTQYFENYTYHKEAGPGMYLLFLSTYQENQPEWQEVLKKYEFNKLAGPFRNPRMRNTTKVVIYGRVNTFEWYSQFLPDDLKEIWKAPLNEP
jgi:hypothetical protein